MPTLNWIGKDKVVSHHNEVPFHVLDHKYGYTAESGQTQEETHSGNMIIHGDNLLALKSSCLSMRVESSVSTSTSLQYW